MTRHKRIGVGYSDDAPENKPTLEFLLAQCLFLFLPSVFWSAMLKFRFRLKAYIKFVVGAKHADKPTYCFLYFTTCAVADKESRVRLQAINLSNIFLMIGLTVRSI